MTYEVLGDSQMILTMEGAIDLQNVLVWMLRQKFARLSNVGAVPAQRTGPTHTSTFRFMS